MGKLRLNHHKHHINLCNSLPISIRTSISLSIHHNSHTRSKITIICNISRTSTPRSNHARKEGVVETSEEEEEEEDLVEEEVRLHAITMDTWAIMPETTKILQRHAHIVKRRTIMWNNVLS